MVIDVSPFPVLVATEYKRRFGYSKHSTKNRLEKLLKDLRREQKQQGLLLGRFQKELDTIKNNRISVNGLKELSGKSVTQIQNQRNSSMLSLQKYCISLLKSSRKITDLEYQSTSIQYK